MKDLDRRKAAGRFFRFLVLILMMLGGAWLSLMLSMRSHDGERRIEPNSVFEYPLSGGEVHRYRVHLRSDQSLRVIVEQRGIDLELHFFDSEGTLVRDYDSPTHDQGNEYGLLVSQSENDFSLEVRSVFENSPPGQYRLQVEYLGPASARDRNLYRGLVLDYQADEIGVSPNAFDHREQILGLKARALEHYRAADYARAVYFCRMQLANLFNLLGEPERALRLLRQLLREVGEPGRAEALKVDETWAHLDWLVEQNLSAELHQTLGWIYFSRGAPERALGYFELAARAGKSDERKRIEAIRGLGRAHLGMGNASPALEAFEEALGYWHRRGHGQRVSLVLQDIGMVHETMGGFARAQDAYARSLELAKPSSFRPYEIPNALIRVGRMELATGKEARALDRFEEALGHLQDPRLDRSNVLFEIAEMHRAAERREMALELYSRALEEARAHGNSRREMLIHLGLAELHRADDRWVEALEWSRSASRLAEAERSSALNPNLTNPLLASSQPFYELQVELLMELHRRDPDAGHAIEAFETSERSRARSLLEELPRDGESRAPTKPDLMHQRQELEQRFDATMEAQRRSGQGSLLAWGEASPIRAEQLDLLNRQTEVHSSLRAHAVRAEPLGLPEIREHALDAETMLLEYELGASASWLWAVTKERLISVELPPRAEIEAAARQLYKGVTARAERRDFETDEAQRRRIRKADASYPRAAAELSRLLLAPIAGLLNDQRLVVVGDEILQSIPFAILTRPGPSGSPEPLIARHEIVGAPSASVLASLRTRRAERAPAARTLTILADPVFDAGDPRLTHSRSTDSRAMEALSPEAIPDHGKLRDALRSSGLAAEALARLPATGEEARRISRRLSAGEAFVALGLEATRELALAGGLVSSRILHFASHAMMASDFPELSGIVLTQFDAEGRPVNGFLTAADIRRLELSADLVVLSACRTALGKDVRGEGSLGLHRGFMAAGTPAVLASVWSLQDRATAELMDRFYQGLLEEGLGPAAALRRAQLSLWREGYEPYYWGGFVLQGDWRAMAIRDSATRRALASVPSSNGG